MRVRMHIEAAAVARRGGGGVCLLSHSNSYSIIRNLRGGDVKKVFSRQASHKDEQGNVWEKDCGLCALKNITGVMEHVTLKSMLEVLHANQPVPVYVPGEGNFSGEALKVFLRSMDYAPLTGVGNVSNHVEFFCQAFGPRVVGVVWRVGNVGGKDKVAHGHWVGMTYEHDAARDFAARHWHYKDGAVHHSVGEAMDTTAALAKLEAVDSADTAKLRDWFLVMDCK